MGLSREDVSSSSQQQIINCETIGVRETSQGKTPLPLKKLVQGTSGKINL